MAFREAIRQSPDEDLPRLVFADWLDEQGDPLGEFIRIQCELARLPWYEPRSRPLRRRERQLLTEHRQAWSRDLPLHGARIDFERGFPHHVSLPADRFLEHSKKFFEAAPIQSARLSSADPWWRHLADCEDLKQLRYLSLQCTTFVSPRFFSRNLEGLVRLDLSEANLDEKNHSTLFVSSMLGNLRAISLPSMAMKSDLLTPLVDSSIGRNLKELRLPFLPASDETIPQLLRLLSYGNLQRLDLPYVTAFMEGRLWELLASEHVRSLKVLSLDYGAFSGADVFGLLSAPNLEGLKELHLKWVRRVNDQVTLPKLLFSSLTKLKALNLADCHCPALVQELLKSQAMPELVWLRLEGNSIGAEAMQAFADSGSLSRLGEIALKDCSLGAEELLPILAATDWGQVDELQLSMNPFGDQGAVLLAECPHLEQIRKLDLSRCGITSAGAKALAESPYLRNLEELSLDENQIDDRGARALTVSPHLENLLALLLRQNPISPKVKRALEQWFGTLRLVIN